MGESNTPPVSPRESQDPDSDDDEPGTALDQDDFEVVELSDLEELEGNDAENDDEEGMEESESRDVPDDSIYTFDKHSSKQLLHLITFFCIDLSNINLFFIF